MTQTATNPQTGERVELVDGAWVPIKTATNPETGERIELIGGQWTPIVGQQQATPETTDAPKSAVNLSPANIGAAISSPAVRQSLANKMREFAEENVLPDGIAESLIDAVTRGAAATVESPIDAAKAVGKALVVDPAKSIVQAPANISKAIGSAGMAAQSALTGDEESAAFYGGQAVEGAQQAGFGALEAATLGRGGTLQALAKPQAKVTPAQSATPSIIQEGEKAGVKILTSDVRDPKTFAGRWLQAVGEKLPVAGTGPLRAKQQEQRIEAVNKAFDQYSAFDDVELSDVLVDDLFKVRGEKIAKYATQKQEVFEGLTDAIPVNNTVKAIDDEIASLTKDVFPKEIDADIGKMPKSWQNDLMERQGKQKLSGKTLPRLKDFAPVINKLEDWKRAIQNEDITEIEKIRKQMGESFKGEDMASIANIGQKSLNRIYPAMNKDIGEFIESKKGVAAKNKWGAANKELSKLFDDLDSNALKSVIRSGQIEPEKLMKMILSKDKSKVKLVYKSLSNEGRATARIAVMQDIAKKSLSANDIVSPEKFVSAVRARGNALGVFFEPEDLQSIKGLTQVINATRRAGQSGVMSPTGVQAVPFWMGAALTDIFGGMGGATVGALGAGGIANLYESKPVRNLFLNISKTKSGSPEEAKLIERLAQVLSDNKEVMAQVAAIEAVNQSTQTAP